MIYSASRRTDLVSFYPDYICEKVSRSRKLEAIVLWTKDPRNLIRHIGLQAVIRSFPTILQLTITGLSGSRWEPQVPHYKEFSAELREIAQILPPGAIRWRFDPIIPDDTLYQRVRAVRQFLIDCGVTIEEVTVSLPDAYRRVTQRLRRYNTENGLLGTPEELRLPDYLSNRRLSTVDSQLSTVMRNLHKLAGVPLALCCEPELLGQPEQSVQKKQTAQAGLPGMVRGRCIDGALIERLYGIKLARIERDGGQRADCACDRSVDIGSYEQRCGHNCLYCYARPEIDGAD